MGFERIKRAWQFFIGREEELKKAVEQFFFLYYPTSRKAGDKTIERSNAQDREDYIKQFGKECFEDVLEDCPHLAYLKDPDIPFCFRFIFSCFLEIYNFSGEQMTWTDIHSYAIMRHIEFRQIELDFILKCCNWANAKKQEMRDEDNPKPSTEDS